MADKQPAVLPPLRVPFEYVVNAVVGANASVSVSLQVQQDSDFEWVFRIASRTDPRLTVLVEDGATGRKLTSVAVNIDNFAGTAQLPFPLVEPFILARATSVNFTFTDSSGAPNTVQLVLSGYKLFPQENPAQGAAGDAHEEAQRATRGLRPDLHGVSGLGGAETVIILGFPRPGSSVGRAED